MVRINDNLSIPDNEISFVASRSGGPGGQNVNKVSSRVTLSFDVRLSAALSDEQKTVVLRSLGKRVNKEGILQIVSQRTRSQDMNRAEAMGRLQELVDSVAVPPRPRRATKPTLGSKKRRLEAKNLRSQVKLLRGKVSE